MAKRYIGIDISSSGLCAIQLSEIERQICIEKVFSVPLRRSIDLAPNIFKTLTSRHNFDRHADIAISMPQDAVFFRNIETDAVTVEQEHAISESVLEHNFPIGSGESITHICSHRQLSDERYSVLVAAVKRELVYEKLNTLDNAKIHPKRIEAVISAVHSTVMINHPEIMTDRAIIVYINGSYITLAITQDDDILMVRNIPIVSGSDDNAPVIQKQVAEVLLREAEITWRKVFGDEAEKDTKIYLATGDNIYDGLKTILEESLHYQIIPIDPYAKVKCPAEYKSDAGIVVAEGLALRLLSPEKTTGINFLDMYKSRMKPTLDLKKEFVIYAILIAAIAVVSLVGLFMKLSHLEATHTRIKNEIREVFQTTLPEETNIINPLIQMEQKLRSLRDNYAISSAPTDGLGPLAVLHAITTSVPLDAKINISSLFITAGSVRLTGVSNSFESVYNWQRLLEEVHGFSSIDVQNVKREPGGQLVNFTILISTATMESE